VDDSTTTAKWPHPLGRTTPRHWGDGSWIWTGLDVIDGLVQAIQNLADGQWKPGGSHYRPVVLACSPWLTDPDVVTALLRTDCCVVIAKESRTAWGQVARLQDKGSGVPKLMLRRLDFYATPAQDGTPVEAYGHEDPNPAHDVQLGPARVTGWRRVGSEGRKFPLMHAKIAVLGYYDIRRRDADGHGAYETADFRPVAAWTGSANFTIRSRVSGEIGMLTNDDDLVAELYDFVIDAIRISEPLNDTGPDDPSPELVDADSYEPTSADLEYMRERHAEYMEEHYRPDWYER
jgi:hypothetical protein